MPTLTHIDLQILGLRCSCCAEAVLDAVRELDGVSRAALDYQSSQVSVELDLDRSSELAVREAVRRVGYRTAGEDGASSTGELAHDADLAPITCHTKCDRMQYELPHSRAQEAHREPADYPRGGHGAMDHDMSDPRMAAAMERDMRNRFFIALVLTIPVIVFSPTRSRSGRCIPRPCAI